MATEALIASRQGPHHSRPRLTKRAAAAAAAPRPPQDALRHTDGQLRRLFSWYSTLDDPRVLPWERVVEYGVTITADDTVLMLLNFEVGQVGSGMRWRPIAGRGGRRWWGLAAWWLRGVWVVWVVWVVLGSHGGAVERILTPPRRQCCLCLPRYLIMPAPPPAVVPPLPLCGARPCAQPQAHT